MKLSRRFRWIMILLILFVLFALFWTQKDSVRAAFSNMHAAKVLYRVQTEIMEKTPAGQYYESLFWKHNDEMMTIMNAHPEHTANLWQATRLFIPELEALLNGDGDKVYITPEHVEGLQAELDWFASVGSPGFREDIQKEQNRFPLKTFVGMSMSEALDFINSNWSPDPVIQKTVPLDSDGKWAYYVYDGVYLEYPMSYNLQVSQMKNNFIYFMPATGSPEQWNPCVMKVRIWNLPADQKSANDPVSWYPPESIVWKNEVENPEFQGSEFISSIHDFSRMEFHAFQYNGVTNIAVDTWVFVNENPQLDSSFDYLNMVNERYEYFQHLAESLRILKH